MNTPSSIRAAYERGRLRDAAVQTAPVLVLPALVLTASGGVVAQGVLGLVLLVCFFLLRWRGRGWGRGAVLGVLAGAFPALVAACLVAEGLGCVGPGCASWCASVCRGAGIFGGALLGFRAREPSAIAAGVLVAGVAGALGCWPMGFGVVGGMVASLAVAALAVVGVRALAR